jgi:hypothetical protein
MAIKLISFSYRTDYKNWTQTLLKTVKIQHIVNKNETFVSDT